MRAGARPAPGRRRTLLLAAVVLGALALAGCGPEAAATGDVSQSVLDPAGPVAAAEDALWDLVFPIAVGVFVLVEGALIYALWRFRDKGGDDIPRQIAGNTFIEVVWTVIPALILVGVAIPTVSTIFSLAEEPEDAVRVRVVGKQYWWAFEYLDEAGRGVVTASDLHIPAGRPVYLEMQSLSAVESDPGWAEIGGERIQEAGSVGHVQPCRAKGAMTRVASPAE